MKTIEEKVVDYMRTWPLQKIEFILNIAPGTQKKDEILYDILHNYQTRKFDIGFIMTLAREADYMSDKV